ncbi:calcium-binding protein [Nodosilinea nodulosa]|uniref:calcium-binding protein n=1 Tax=Nodosilinea nodulosa TaxID=416001 RepID=UPI00037C7BEE|nr:calcium-binding protein [Nodosilinea nodulosa]
MTTSPPTSRSPLDWPFASDSIWNQPIGSEAQYVAIDLAPAANLQVDEDHFYVLSDGDPLRPLFSIGNWENGRATGTIYQNIALPLPDDFAIADSKTGDTPNNSAAFLLPDGRTLVQVNALTRLPATPGTEEFVYGWRAPNEDILGPGIGGGHAGSGLSSIGGTLRTGELTGPDPIHHALKINLWAQRYFSYEVGAGGGRGYRWPADRADSYASPDTYGGSNPALMLGSLLALPPDLTPEQLGLETEAALKLFYAFQDYGAYIADDTAFNAHAFALEVGAKEEFEAYYGYSFEDSSSPFYDDVMTLFSALAVVDNNGPESIGGGGVPRAPLAPPLSEADLAIAPPVTDPTAAGAADPNSPAAADPDSPAAADPNSPPDTNPPRSQYLTADENNSILYGGPQGDFLYGDGGNNILHGGEGNDYLDGVAGNNQLFGDGGDDLLAARLGGEQLEGGEGTDTLLVAADTAIQLTDTTLGGPQAAERSPRPELATALGIGPAEIGPSQLSGSTLASIERATLVGGKGDNWLDAAAFSGAAHLDGGEGNDWLIGGTGANDLRGGTGSDGLIGGPGDDVLRGSNELQQGAIDWLMGGGGSDLFILAQAGDQHYLDRNGQPNYAVIEDFDPSQDQIQLIDTAESYRLVPSVLPGLTGILPSDRPAVSLVWTRGSASAPDLLAVLFGPPELLDISLQSQAFIYDSSA